MITHDYSEWHEPEKPPFTVEDLISAVKELMMQYHVSFDEALKHLQEKGIPYNEFLKIGGLDELIQGFLDKINGDRQKILENHRLDDLLSKLEEDVRRKSAELQNLMEKLKDAKLTKRLEDSLQSRDPSSLYNLDSQLSRSGQKGADEIRRQLQTLTQLMQQLKTLQDMYEDYEFTGDKSVTSA